MLRRLFTILLFCCLVIPFIGNYVWTKYQVHLVRKEIKHQIIAGIDTSALVRIIQTPENQFAFEWKHNKEFRLYGQMYDIVYRSAQGDSIVYWCWWDQKETQLNQQLSSLLQRFIGSDPKTKDQHNKLKSFCKNLFFQTMVNINFPWWVSTGSSFQIKYWHVLTSYLQIPKPPPKSFV